MKKFKQTQLHKNLRAEHRKRLERRPLGYLLMILLISFILSSVTALITPLYSYTICFYIFIIGAVTGIVVFLTTYIAGYQSIDKTAQNLDIQHNAKNRLETTLELSNAVHPLKEHHYQETNAFYSGHKFSYWRTLRLLLIIAVLLFSWMNIGMLKTQHKRYKKEVENLEKEQEPGKQKTPLKPKEKASNDSAELKLVLPESETRAKPLDEIEWSGVGQSSSGFQKLTLSVYVNGKFVKDIAPDETPAGKTGNIKVNGFLALDEFNVQPFDLVSYHLTAYSQINDNPTQKIISSPQFIEIRPFREDAFFKEGGDAGNEEMQNMLAVLVRFLRLQIELNKATFTARIMRQQAHKDDLPTYHKFLQTVREEQKNFNGEVEEFLNSEIARKFPAETINNIEKANKNINDACIKLEHLD